MKRILLLAVILTANLIAAAQTAPEDWARFYRYSDANKTVTSSPKAVFMGDSITDSWAKKEESFFADNNFLGRGISGQTTSHMLVRFRKDVLDLAPEYVVILAGTNDIALNNGYITLDNILGNIKSMCELAMLHNIKPVLCSVLPADRYKWRPELQPADNIIRINEMIKEYAQCIGAPYVDYHSALKNGNNGLSPEHSHDGVHPNSDCYKIMEKIILQTLR